MGRERYPKARELTITADGGGSNGTRVRLWKVELQKLADETGLVVHVHHYPPGTSKWNKIEHRLFCHITQTWRGRPLVDRMAVVELIAATTTKAGLSLAGVRLARHAALPPLGAPVLRRSPCACVPPPIPRWGRWVQVSLNSPATPAFPRFNVRGSGPPHHPFRGLLSVHYALQPARSPRVTKVTLYTEGFSRFVASTTAPIATGWSDSCRVGLSPH